MSVRRWGLLSIVGFFLLAAMASAQEFTVAAAADLQFAMQDISTKFEQKSSNHIKVIYGSSGNFAQQIQNGAPFDMFFSANIDYPKQLEASGLTEPDSLYQYAKGKIVVWVPNDSHVDVHSGVQALLAPSIKKIAIANPQHAPYGKAAVSAMEKAGVYDKVKDKLVLGENISQTASFVVSGSADVGIVALSLALSPNMKSKGRFTEIPGTDYPPIEQACVILRASKNTAAAKAFLEFMKTDTIKDVLRNYGFEVSGSPQSK
jgi:molybdate transport system substrate-binding protein